MSETLVNPYQCRVTDELNHSNAYSHQVGFEFHLTVLTFLSVANILPLKMHCHCCL
jgi:hypothetical protein